MSEPQARTTSPARRSTVVLTTRSPAAAARAAWPGLGRGDSSGAIVVTPAPLAARALGVAHRSLTDLAVGVLAERDVRFAGALTRRAALQAAVEETWSVDDVAGTARSVESTVRELLFAGVGSFVADAAGPDAGARPGSVVALGGYPRLGRLVELAAAYRRQLAAEGAVDRAEALWLAAAGRADGGSHPSPRYLTPADPHPERRVVVVCGYPLLAPAEMAFLTSFAADGSLVVLPQAPAGGTPSAVARDTFAPNEETAARLAERGWQVVRDQGAIPSQSVSEPVDAPVKRIEGYRLASIDAEVRFVLTRVKELLLQGADPADIALVAPDPAAYGPAASSVGREYGVPVSPSFTVPLAVTPLGHLVGSLAGVVSTGLPFEETARLLSNHLVHPLSQAAWQEARRLHPSGLRQWQRIDSRASLLDWPRRATRAEYTTLLEATLEGLGGFDLLESEPQGSRHLVLLRASMAAYAASAGAGTPGRTATAVTLAAFVGELLDHLQLITVAWTGRGSPVTGGVALIAAPAVAGAALRHVFVLGAAEGAVPARLDPGARLDFVEREVARGAGLPVTGAVQAARGQALTFDAIMRAAHESLTLTFPESGERDGQLPSPYFAALNLNPTLDAHASRVNGRKQAASLQELRRYLVASGDGRSLGGDVVLAAARHALAVESRRESAEPPDEYDGIIGEPYPTSSQPFSATSLSALGQCAFKWFAEYCLRLEEPQEAEEELSPLVRGNLYHETLRFAFEAASLHGEPTRDRVLAALPAAFARAEDTEAKDTVNWQHHRGQHLAALHRVVRAESFLPEATEVVGSETLFGYGHGRPATWRGFDVRGRIDRIDRRSGVLTLVDYKTSASKPLGVQDASGEATVDVQLPIYLEAAVPALGLVGQGEPSVAEPAARQAPSPTQVAAEYYSLTKGRVIWSTAATGEGAFDGAALDGFAERAHAALATGRYPVRPDRARRACGHCAFDPVCRVGPRVERKRSGDG